MGVESKMKWEAVLLRDLDGDMSLTNNVSCSKGHLQWTQIGYHAACGTIHSDQQRSFFIALLTCQLAALEKLVAC